MIKDLARGHFFKNSQAVSDKLLQKKKKAQLDVVFCWLLSLEPLNALQLGRFAVFKLTNPLASLHSVSLPNLN